jgi:hypothetical protein
MLREVVLRLDERELLLALLYDVVASRSEGVGSSSMFLASGIAATDSGGRTLPAYMSDVSDWLSRGNESGRTSGTRGTVSSMTDLVELLDRTLAGIAPRAKGWALVCPRPCAEERERNRGTTNDLPAAGVVIELFGSWSGRQRRDMLRRVVWPNVVAGKSCG